MKVRWFKKPKPVILGWQDAQDNSDSWQRPSDMTDWAKHEQGARIKTAGMLLGESKHYYYLTGCTQCDGNFYRNNQRIPKGCITDIERLRRGKQKRVKGKLPKSVR